MLIRYGCELVLTVAQPTPFYVKVDVPEVLSRLIELTESDDEEVVGLAIEELYQRSQDLSIA